MHDPVGLTPHEKKRSSRLKRGPRQHPGNVRVRNGDLGSPLVTYASPWWATRSNLCGISLPRFFSSLLLFWIRRRPARKPPSHGRGMAQQVLLKKLEFCCSRGVGSGNLRAGADCCLAHTRLPVRAEIIISCVLYVREASGLFQEHKRDNARQFTNISPDIFGSFSQLFAPTPRNT